MSIPMSTWGALSVNDNVKVRLTDFGRQLVRQHFEGYFSNAVPHPVLMPKDPVDPEWSVADDQGYVTVRFGDLLSILGIHCGAGTPAPFEPEILIALRETRAFWQPHPPAED